MKERPILFSAPMILANRAGIKTQTRRTRGLKDINEAPDAWELLYSGGVDSAWWTFAKRDTRNVVEKLRCPYGVEGDRLWVRESGKISDDGRIFIYSAMPGECRLKTPGDYHPAAHSYKPVPSIHMPRWASRDSLEVISVRPERLRDITEADAKAEGCEPWFPASEELKKYSREGGSYRNGFHALWESINGPGSWAKNPWLWRIEYRKAQA